MAGSEMRVGYFVSCVTLAAGAAATCGATPVAMDPFAPAGQQVEARFDAIDQEIVRLNEIGQTATADAMAAQLQHFRDEYAGLAPSDSVGPELDLVDVYSGLPASAPSNSGPGTVTVHVGATDRPVVLALGGATAVNWDIQLDPGAQLQRLILSNSSQVVLNAPAGVPVGDTGMPIWFGAGKDWDVYPSAARTLYGMTGLPLSSVQGVYNYAGTPFVVGEPNADWRAQEVLREMNGLYRQATAYQDAQARAAVAGDTFTGLLQDWRQQHQPGGPLVTRVARLSPGGEITGSPLVVPDMLTQLAVDESRGTDYALTWQSISRLDPATGTLTPMDVTGPGVPELSWPVGLTFDTRRDRLLLASLGGEGFLYAYAPSTGAWSVVSSMHDVDLGALTYRAADDTLYGWDAWSGDIRKFDADGNPIGMLAVPDVPHPGTFDSDGWQLLVAGDYLALITRPLPDLYEPERDPQPWCYLIDPDTGALVYSGMFAVPEPDIAPVAGIVGLAATRLRRRRRHAVPGQSVS